MTIAAKASLLHLSLVDAADALREASITSVALMWGVVDAFGRVGQTVEDEPSSFEPALKATKEPLP